MVTQPTRSQQSREWIILALLQLMESTPYSQLSITEIARKAGLARQTFYRNYQDKDDILFDYLCQLYAEFWLKVDEPNVLDENMFISLFRMWKEHAPVSLVTNINNRDRKIRQIIFRSLEYVISELVQPDSEAKKPFPLEGLDYYAQRSLSSTLHVLLTEWTLREFRETPDEIGRLAFQLTSSMRALL